LGRSVPSPLPYRRRPARERLDAVDAVRQLRGPDLERRASVDLGEPTSDRGGEGRQVLLGPQLTGERADPAGFDAAGDDPLERLEIVVHVDGEAVSGDATVHVHADRADLARLVNRLS